MDLYIDSTKREALTIPEPLWRSLVDAMIRDVSDGHRKYKAGVYRRKWKPKR